MERTDQQVGPPSPAGALVEPPVADERERLVRELQLKLADAERHIRSLRERQRELEESRARFAELYEFAPVACFTLDPMGCILGVNQTGAAMLGHDAQALIGQPLVPLVRIEDPTGFWAHLRRCGSTRASVVSELALCLTRTGRIHVQAVSAPVLDSAGEVVAFRTALADISARKQAAALEKDARRAEQRLRAQIEAVDRAAVAVANSLASPGATTAGVLATIARHAAALVDAELGALAFGEQVAAHPALPGLDGVLAALPLEGVPLRIPDVREHPAFAGFPASHPLIASVVVVPIVFSDVTLGSLLVANKLSALAFTEQDQHTLSMLAERVGYALEVARLSAAQAREHDRLGLLADTGRALTASLDVGRTVEAIGNLAIPRFADFAMMFLQEGGVLRAVSAAHRDAAAKPRVDALLGRQVAPQCEISKILRTRQAALHPRLTPKADPELSLLSEIAGALDVDSFIGVPLVARDHVEGVMLFGADGTNRRYDSMDLAVAEEIAYRTALALDNAHLYQVAQAAVAARDNLMAIVSHDLRNPLNAIFVNLGLLLRTSAAADRPRGHRQLELIKQSSEHLNRLVEDLVTASTIDAGYFTVSRQPEAVNLLLDDLQQNFEPLATERGTKLEVIRAADSLKALCDRDRMFQVFSNLVSNAIKATPRGGTITVEAFARGDWVEFSVRDNGPGIAAQNIPFLFDRFWRDAANGKRGVGLGLYIVKAIVENHGGRVWVESHEGATFWLSLPLAR